MKSILTMEQWRSVLSGWDEEMANYLSAAADKNCSSEITIRSQRRTRCATSEINVALHSASSS